MMITMLTLLTLVSSLSGGIRYRENFLEEVLGDMEDIRESLDSFDAYDPMEDMHLTEPDMHDIDHGEDHEQPIEVDKAVEIEMPHPTAKTPEPEVANPPKPNFSTPPVVPPPKTPIQMPPSACASNAGFGNKMNQPVSQVRAWEPDAMDYASV